VALAPLDPATERALRVQQGLSGSLPLCTRRRVARTVWRERNWRRDGWEPTQEATEIDPRPQEFRASWESTLAAAGVDRADLAQYAGHSVQTANAHYVQALDRSAEQVRNAIG
jgi:hypothetical protein